MLNIPDISKFVLLCNFIRAKVLNNWRQQKLFLRGVSIKDIHFGVTLIHVGVTFEAFGATLIHVWAIFEAFGATLIYVGVTFEAFGATLIHVWAIFIILAQLSSSLG